MTTRSFSFVPEEFYHVYNRGVEKRTIYQLPSDYRRFTDLLYAANGTKSIDMRSIERDYGDVYEWNRGEPLVAIGAYCLMPNHFHILLTPLQENGVAQFMNKLCTSYSMYFNKKNDRTGALFEGKFKAKWIDSDEYLKYLYSYIHLNPVKLIQPDWKENGIIDPESAYKYASEYKSSSLFDYLGHGRKEKGILNKNLFPSYFQTSISQRQELFEWLNWKDIST